MSKPFLEIRSVSIAALFSLREIPPLEIRSQPNGFALFVYERTPEAEELLRSYLDRSCLIDARTFSDRRDELKQRHALGLH